MIASGEATVVRIVSVMRQCVMKNPAAGGGRWVEVPPERFVSWIITFAERHGGADGVAAAWPTIVFPTSAISRRNGWL